MYTPATTTHATLIARVADGADPGAWREFCDRYGDLIRSFARRRGLQESDCDDVLQDVLLALNKALPGFVYDPSKGKFRGYLKTVVVRNIAKKRCQSHGEIGLEHIEEATRAADQDAETEQLWEAEWRQYHLRQALRLVSAEFNAADIAAFQSYAVDGADVAQVATQHGMSHDQVYQAKSRILRRLSAVIEAQVAEEG